MLINNKTPMHHGLRYINSAARASYPFFKLISPFLHHNLSLIKISCMVVCATNIVGISVHKLDLNSVGLLAHLV